MTLQSVRCSFNALLRALADGFETEDRAGALLAVNALRDALSGNYRRTGSTSDPDHVLTAACSLSNAWPAAAHVLACRSMLDWTSWEGEGLSSEISSRLYTTELLGPDGHISAEHVRVGLLLSDTGEETYLVLSGVAEWTVNNGPYMSKPPGSLIHHPASEPHGRRTKDEPFLGAWRWSGNLDLSSFSVA